MTFDSLIVSTTPDLCKILVIDDDEDDIFLVRQMLDDAQGVRFHVDWAISFETGRAMLYSNLYDAVIVDYDLGAHSGIDLIRELNQQSYETPFILFTGRGSYEVDLEAMAAGVIVYLTKGETSTLMLERSIRYAIERKQIEEALKDSNRKITEILSSITDDFYVLDREWKFVYANRQFTGRINKEPRDFIGNNIWEMFPKHVGSVLYDNLHDSMDKAEKRRFEIGGEYTDAWYSMTSFPSPEGITVLGTDITQSKRQEKRREYLLKLSDALRPLADPANIMNTAARILGEQLRVNHAFYAEARNGDWSVVNVLNAFQKGTPPQAEGQYLTGPLGEWMLDTFKSGQRLVVSDLDTDPRFNKSQRAAHARLSIKASVAVPLVKEGIFVGLLAVHSASLRNWTEHEISLVEETAERTWAAVEQVRAKNAMSTSEARLHAVLKGLPVGVWITDADGRIVEKNNQSDTIWAGNAPMAEGIDQYHLYQSWDAASGRELQTDDFPLTRTLKSGRPVEAEEHRIRRLDGSTGYVLVSATPIQDDEGRTTGAVAINLDITEYRQSEAVLREYSRGLEESGQKIENSDILVSQDIQESLQKIKYYANSLKTKLQDQTDEEMRNLVRGLLEATQKM